MEKKNILNITSEDLKKIQTKMEKIVLKSVEDLCILADEENVDRDYVLYMYQSILSIMKDFSSFNDLNVTHTKEG